MKSEDKNENGVFDTLLAHVKDLLARSGKGVLCSTSFLSLREQAELSRALPGVVGREAVLYGGYEGAERCRLYCLPDYLTGMMDREPEQMSYQELSLYLGEEWQDSVAVLHVQGSGYRELDHRDYLGSLLALGIQREVLGDIVALDGHEAYVFCQAALADYLTGEWKTVGADAVKVSRVTLPEGFAPVRRFSEIHDTVASDRLDCMVAALTDLAREKAQNLIKSGLVEVDHLPEERTDRSILPGTVLSIRGFGRYQVMGLEGQTKKGRWRLSARKFI